MNEEKFWRIIYLYITKYGYDMIHYRPEKKDVWLINRYNEVYRFVYLDNFNIKDVDSSVYNIIKNEKILKKSFKLNILKVKAIYLSPITEHNTSDYKKYKVSNTLTVERILFNDNNKNNFVKASDDSFLNIETGIDRYKNKVLYNYKQSNKINTNINISLTIFSFFLVFLFCLNYLFLNLFDTSVNIYSYIDFDFNKIISGEFHRLFTNMYIYSDIKELFISVLAILFCSILLGDSLKLGNSLIIMSLVSLFNNLFIILGYFDNINISSLAIFGFLGSVFISEFNNKNNNLYVIYSVVVTLLYFIFYSMFFDINISVYMFSFILGIFINIILMKRLNYIISYVIIFIIVLSGILIIIFNIDIKSKINNYTYNLVYKNLQSGDINIERLHKLENEIKTNKKSAVTYYELGMLKLKYSSIYDAKNVFLEGLKFDDNFAPIYYELALISRAEFDKEKSSYYINKAISIDGNNDEYKDLQKELSLE